ncbi:hypothetical protein PPSIR1_40944 [Plesiocystis pacifica SIR-1]|uniref:Uncharacterized protein n=1 Tax=Plesiocystis pacifica SIR-1 TaxID=391625 RepID=A6GFZ7_9BACT|nr:hypothetical protein PPSIR1_40944 [Plesiocystis pacifica SIR-1]
MLASVAALVGCATVHETHYFRSAGEQGAVNYYRVQVTAKGRATKVRYLAGYFDTQAVEQYFSEFAQPKEGLDGLTAADEAGEGEPEASDTAGEAHTEAETVEPIDPKLRDRELVLMLSTNVEDVAAQIGALAESMQVQNALSELVNRERLEAEREAAAALEADRVAAASLVRTAEQTRVSLGDKERSAEEILRLANALAAYLGSTQRFEDLGEARAWLAANRARLHAELGAP